MSELTDLSKMPFGQYEGIIMQEVPASYLHYLWQKGLKFDEHAPVALYIRTNLNALKQEHPDGIW